MNPFNKYGLIGALVLCLGVDAPAQLARQWVARFSGDLKNGSNAATAMTVDDSGNVYVTGYVSRKSTKIDFATIKYTPDGEQVWVAYYSNSSGEDQAKAITVDTGYNVYVTGASNGSPAGKDYATVKYDKNGVQQWVARYNGPGNSDDVPTAIAVNDSLNVYVTGWSWGGLTTGFDYATIKYNAAGVEQWVKRYNGPGSKTDSALGMALRGSTDLYVVGTSIDSMYDYATIKYSAASGDSLWVVRYNGPANGVDIARTVALRSSTEVYITGSSQGIGTGYDYATIKYNSSGVVQWVSRYNDPANGDDHANAISIFSSSRVYVTGKALNVGSYNDIVTVRYSQGSGSESWVSSYNGPANDDDIGIMLSGGSNPYVVGPSAGVGTAKDFALIEYNGSNGSEVLNTRYNGPANDDDIPYAVLSSGGGIYVAGSSKSKAKGSDFLTIKYVPFDKMKYRTFVQDSLSGKGVVLKLASAVPNIANVRDTAFARAYPKIKRGYPGFPGGMVIGNPRPDSASSFGWIRIDKGKAIATFVPHTLPSRGFDAYNTSKFVGEKKNPKLEKYNNHIVGEMVALRINIGASDAEVTPQTFGDLTYDDGDTSNHFNGMTLRQLAGLIDNYLTYWPYYPVINWARLDTMLSRVNRGFQGSLKIVSKQPLVVTGAVHIDSVFFVKPVITPLLDPLAFIPGSLEETPQKYQLLQNYPNPFNPATTIAFDLPEVSLVTVDVYNILGQRVFTLVENEEFEAGRNEVLFDARSLASGVYFYHLVVNNGEYQHVKKMVLLK